MTASTPAPTFRAIPIIFSAPMVRALLDGRKTMTRRLANREKKLPREADGNIPGVYVAASPWQKVKPGDRLWVREAMSVRGVYSDVVEVGYRAHERASHTEFVEQFPVADAPGANVTWPRYRPSIHMPRWASRLTLIVTATKIERLQDISVIDVRAEGCEVRNFSLFGSEGAERQKIAAGVFRELWTSLHGPVSWDANPEVVALSFTVHKTNIDAMERAA